MDNRTKFAGSALAGLLALVAFAGCSSEADPDKDAGAAKESGADVSTAPVELTNPVAGAGKCAVPSAQLIAGADTAFEATVAAVDADGAATLAVSQWLHGDDQPAEVTVRAPEEDLSGLLPVVTFEEGNTYLVSATDGSVSMCGLSGEKTPELEALYAEAFGQ